MHEIEKAPEVRPSRRALDVTWVAHEFGVVRAGEESVARLVLVNSGAATWRSRDGAGVLVSYHWLDKLGNPVVWDCPRTRLPYPVGPGARVEVSLALRAPIPPGAYVLAFDLLEEFQFWFSEVGVPMLEVPCTVQNRIAERRLGVVVHSGPGDESETRQALARQEEPVVEDGETVMAHLVAGCIPEPDWSRRLLDAHAEGFAAVGGATVPAVGRASRRHWAWLRPWQPREGRNPRFREPLLLPSLVRGLEPSRLNGWPAYYQEPDVPWDEAEPALFDGRIVIILRPRSGRRRY